LLKSKGYDSKKNPNATEEEPEETTGEVRGFMNGSS
tara:strand:- start:670 stop:777 length:108 start_codon:yes stop_codon:yes gene_type:complete